MASNWEYKASQDADLVAWDKLVLQQPGSMIYMLSNYLDEVAPGWGYLQSNEGHCFPVWKSKKWGLQRLSQPLFTQHFSVMSPAGASPPELSSLLQSLQGMVPLANIQIDASICPPHWAWKQHERTTYRLQLPATAAQVQQQYSSHHRRILKKTEQLQLGPSADQQGFIELLKAEMPALTGLRAEQFDVVDRLVTWLSIKRRGQLFTATDGNELLAACYILHSGPRLLYQWAVSSAAGKQRQAMHRLIDHVLCEYAGSGLEFDFEGSMLPGLQRFYAGFGAKPYLYMRLTHSKFPAFLNRLFHVG
jgi:hypothetical protein